MFLKVKQKHLYDKRTDRLFCGRGKFSGIRVESFDDVSLERRCKKCEARRLEIEEYKKNQE